MNTTTQVVTVDFHGQPMIAVKNGDEIHVAMKPIAEAIGLQWEAQYKRIKRHPVMTTCMSVMDIQMPGDDGILATKRVREASPGTRVLVVTTFARPGYLRAALEAGAGGFIVKDAPPEQLADAVRRVHAGLRVVDPALAEASLFEGANPLTERERQVLRLAGDGLSAAAIAAEVFLSAGTVRNHLSAAIGKTGAGNRAEAARIARDKGWI